MKYIAFLLLPFIWFTSCKKDKKSEPTKTELLTSQTWKYNNGGVDQDRNGTIDFTLESTGQLKPCNLDNTGKFNSDGTGIADEGATKCTTMAPQSSPFTWSFQNNETEINILGQGLFGLGGKFTIKELTTTSFSLQKDTTVTVTGFPPTNVWLIVNLKH